MNRLTALAAAAAAIITTPALAETNVMPTAVTSISSTGKLGTLHSGEWSSGASLADLSTLVDGAFLPDRLQWNSGTVWWDGDASVNPAPVTITFTLDRLYTLDRFIVQADNNDLYPLEYWNGAAWLSAWTTPVKYDWGLTTRDSGALTPITTDKLRLTGSFDSDAYFSVSEVQAFGTAAVPEPAAWSLMILGFAGLGGVLRRNRALHALAAR